MKNIINMSDIISEDKAFVPFDPRHAFWPAPFDTSNFLVSSFIIFL